jgi:hypothetical protein
MLHLNKTLHAVTRAFMTLEEGVGEQTTTQLEIAANSLEDARSTLEEAEHSKFTGWYDNDTKFKMDGLEERISAIRTSLNEGRDDE